MAHFLIEGYVPRARRPALGEVALGARRAAEELSREGVEVRHLGAVYVPEDETCFCLFEAPSAEVARRAAVAAAVPFERLIDVEVEV